MMKTNRHFHIRCLIILLPLIGFSQYIDAQSIYDSVYISRVDALSDLDQMDRKFSQNYKPYDLPNMIDGYRKNLHKTKAALPDSITLSDFRKEVIQIIGAFHEAHMTTSHTHPTKTSKELRKDRKKNRFIPTMLPFDLKLEGAEMLRVIYDYRPDSIQTEVIDSIIQFGEMTIREMLDDIQPYVNVDIDDDEVKRRYLAAKLPKIGRAILKPHQQDSVQIVYIDNGVQKKVWTQYVRRKRKKEFKRFRMIDSLSTGIVSLTSFKSLSYETGDGKYRNLHKVGLDSISKYQPDNLIVDLRNNGGGSAKYCRRWMSGFLDKGDDLYSTNGTAAIMIPFLYSRRFKVGNKPKFTRKAKPKDNAYKGNVYVLINEGVFSAAMLFSKSLQKHDRATLIGQPSGQKSYGTHAGYYRYLKLKNSGVRVNIPQIYFKLDDRSIDELTIEGVQPDISLPYDYDVNNSENYDATMEYVLDLIAKGEK